MVAQNWRNTSLEISYNISCVTHFLYATTTVGTVLNKVELSIYYTSMCKYCCEVPRPGVFAKTDLSLNPWNRCESTAPETKTEKNIQGPMTVTGAAGPSSPPLLCSWPTKHQDAPNLEKCKGKDPFIQSHSHSPSFLVFSSPLPPSCPTSHSEYGSSPASDGQSPNTLARW